MTKAAMAAAIKANLDPILPVESTLCDTVFLEAFCEGIITHIQAAAIVPAGINCAVDAGTHTGATTGTGTIQ